VPVREVAYYVHHHGGGHLTRARAICREIDGPVTLLSTLPGPVDLPSWAPAGTGCRRSWVRLAADVTPEEVPGRYAEPDAGGRLHWAPLHHRGLQERNATVLDTIRRIRPALLVADVSVEVATLARISGVPVVYVLLPGERTDPAHRLALDLATAVLAPWPRPPELPGWLEPWLGKTRFTGGIGTAGIATVRRPVTHRDRPTVVAAFGASRPPGDLRAAVSATPGWRWRLPEPTHSMTAWRAQLADADVVVAHTGLGTIADLATVQARAVMLPQERPFGEQRATGELLQHLRIGPVVEGWPDATRWPGLLERAASAPPGAWRAWGVENGARAAAELIGELTE